MNATETVDNWLKAVSKEIDSDLHLGEDNLCPFEFENGVEGLIEVDEDENKVLFYGEAAEIPEDEELAKSMALACLAHNQFNEDTMGSTIAYDPASANITLCFNHSLEKYDIEAFIQDFSNFCETLQNLRQGLEQFAQLKDIPEEDTASDDQMLKA